MDLLFPGANSSSHRHKNRIADVDHLLGHRASGAALFVTSERGILAQAPALRRDFGIEVLSPTDALARVIGSEDL